jgi:hypothetical protein
VLWGLLCWPSGVLCVALSGTSSGLYAELCIPEALLFMLHVHRMRLSLAVCSCWLLGVSSSLVAVCASRGQLPGRSVIDCAVRIDCTVCSAGGRCKACRGALHKLRDFCGCTFSHVYVCNILGTPCCAHCDARECLLCQSILPRSIHGRQLSTALSQNQYKVLQDARLKISCSKVQHSHV